MAFLSPCTAQPHAHCQSHVDVRACSSTPVRRFSTAFVSRSPISRESSLSYSNSRLVVRPSRPYVQPRPIICADATTSCPKILISGAPASGKGTQCELLVTHYGVVHVSTGDMLRAAVKQGTDLGKQAKSYMDAGELVPDSLVISLLEERLKESDVQEKGWLLDGFPRTAVQACALDDAGILPDAVLVLDVPDDVLIERVVGRRLDPETGKIYHVKFNPPPADIEARLTRRSDDTEEKAKTRLQNYYTHAQSILEHYDSKITRVDGNRSKQDVFQSLISIIDAPEVSTNDDDDNNSSPPSEAVVQGPPPPPEPQSTPQPQSYQFASQPPPPPSPSATPQHSPQSTIPGSAKGLSVSEFVQRAEQAYETGVLQTGDVNWSGQASMDDPSSMDTSNYSDLSRRFDLVFGDALMILSFAYIGRASHGDPKFDIELLRTATPFLAAWFLTTPLLGAYTRAATADVGSALKSFARAWAVSIPMGIALRGVLTQHIPPTTFTVITLVTNFILIGTWRTVYVKVRGDEPKEGVRGGVFDGFRMITTLLRRW